MASTSNKKKNYLKNFLATASAFAVIAGGAGDAFGAGFVAGLVKGWDIQRCLELGVEESEAVLGFFGAKNNLLKRKLK